MHILSPQQDKRQPARLRAVYLRKQSLKNSPQKNDACFTPVMHQIKFRSSLPLRSNLNADDEHAYYAAILYF